MFDTLVAAATASSRGAAVTAWAQVENAACARRLSAVADVLEVRLSEDGSAKREQWCMDNWDAVCAEVGACLEVTLGAASNQLMVAMALRERLPQVNEVFRSGRIGYRVVSTIVSRTALVTDRAVQATLDAKLAQRALRWGCMSNEKLKAAVDFWVDRYDPHALRRAQTRSRDRAVDVEEPDGSGLTRVEAMLFDHDAATMDQRLDAMAAAVCPADPRTLDQRRSDALGAVMAGADRLACGCGAEECPAAGATPNAVVINVIAEEKSLSDDSAVILDGADPNPTREAGREIRYNEPRSDVTPTGPADTPPVVMIGGGIIPAPLLAAKIAAGATIRWVTHPGAAPPEPRYRPSVRLDRFVRCRDISCRFPGCDQPADICDVDHTIAYPIGPTCASNLKCLCRKHHLLKTFGGWRDEQQPDGTVIWTAPDGQSFTTRPGSCEVFPALCKPTAEVSTVPDTNGAAQPPGREIAMPLRRRTRAQARKNRIAAQRRLNDAYVAERNKPPPF